MNTGRLRFLVLQHLSVEHPGSFRDCFDAAGVHWDAIEVDAGESIPSLDNYDALWVMGGPQDVWQEAEYPWLREEKAVIRAAAVNREMPVLGVCLGHQLLAEAVGCKVRRMPAPDVGVFDVRLTDVGQAEGWFKGMPAALPALHWHGAEVHAVPDGIEVLAETADCAVQAIGVGRHALGVQFHCEATLTTVPDWVAIPAYGDALEAALGASGPSELAISTQAELTQMQSISQFLFNNFLHVTGLASRLPGVGAA